LERICATIKPLYGRQEGAELGYNPSKPNPLSHALHTFWLGNLRLVLQVQDKFIAAAWQFETKDPWAILMR
jgi:hypothetical protein